MAHMAATAHEREKHHNRPDSAQSPAATTNPAGAGNSARRRGARAHARAARRAYVASLGPDDRAALGQALAARVIPHLGDPGILGSYAATGDEIDPRAIEEAAIALGWKLAFPRVAHGPLVYHVAARADLAPGYHDIPEPPATSPEARPDVVLVPLLLADRLGNRLGQGGGHFDRTLAILRSSGPLLAIGLCWDVQLAGAEEPPSWDQQPWDQPLDAIATPAAFHPGVHHQRR